MTEMKRSRTPGLTSFQSHVNGALLQDPLQDLGIMIHEEHLL
jgi:hypothetical protein